MGQNNKLKKSEFLLTVSQLSRKSGKRTGIISEKESRSRIPGIMIWISVTAILVLATLLFTYRKVSDSSRRNYVEMLQQLQEENSEEVAKIREESKDPLDTLDEYLQQYSYYYDTANSEELLNQAIKAYVESIGGDPYARWYTQEEYETVSERNEGRYAGIGARFDAEILYVEVGGKQVATLYLKRIEPDSPAEQAGLKPGDLLYAAKSENGSIQTIGELGVEAFRDVVRGEPGTQVTLLFYRKDGDLYEGKEFTCTRAMVESTSVTGRILEGNPDTAIVRITGFELVTPKQFRDTVDWCRNAGATKFVFDVRDNPGGDLRSIRAVLSFFLQKGDLVIETQDKNGNPVSRTTVEAVSLSGSAEPCSITEEQIGMYRDLDFVILCNGSTASAAEVFTAALRDYGLTKAVVGETTFGKGILQTTRRVQIGNLTGYLKLTTHTYVTKESSYHGIGILPDIEEPRKVGTEKMSVDELGWEDDIQLQTAVGVLNGEIPIQK